MNQNIYAILDEDAKPKAQAAPKKAAPAPVEAVPVKPSRSTNEDRSRNNRGRNDRGRGGRRGGRGRQYDRRSGTGRGHEIKKGGAGGHNWGSNDDPSWEANGVADAEAEQKRAEGEDGAENADAEPEKLELTFDEYMKQKQVERTGEAFSELEVREVDKSGFEGAQVLRKDDKTPDFVEGGSHKQQREKRSGRKKVAVQDLGFRAPPVERGERTERGGRGRGRGRGGGRGSRGGRGGRGGYENRGPRQAPGGAAVNVTDINDFPTLS